MAPQPDPPIPTTIGVGTGAGTGTGTGTGGGGTSTGGSKKKFGKNLNRLVPASAAAPPPRNTSSRSSSTGGLAFLSTKKSATKSGGTAPQPKSAHDALLTAAAAEAGLVTYPKEEVEEKDAWGTAKVAKEAQERTRAERERVERELENRERERTRQPVLTPGAGRTASASGAGGGAGEAADASESSPSGAAASRPTSPPTSSDTNADRISPAKRAAERRRLEEEERFRKQKEGAARRLRELEEKMGGGTSQPAAPPPPVSHNRGVPAVSASEVESWRQRSRPQQLTSQIKLERLGGGGGGGGGSSGVPPTKSRGGNDSGSSPPQRSIMAFHSSSPSKSGSGGGAGGVAGRSLWDPSGKTFSSLVGGSTTGVTKADANAADGGGAEDDKAAGRKAKQEDEQQRRRPSNPPENEYSRDHRSNSNVSDHDRFAYEEPPPMDHVIHLSSYETTDRGEGQRKKSEQPRMLFDPKSGSMVAAKDLPAGGGGGGGGADRGGKSKRERGRKERKSRAERDRDRGSDGGLLLLRRPSDDGRDDAAADGGKSSRKSKKERSSKRGGKEQKRGGRNSEAKLPRTCGVLYRRDDRGRYVCADGCDADQGYGAYSVPGGRVRNPSGHAAFVKEQKRLQKEAATFRSGGQGGYYGNGGTPMGYKHGQHGDAYGQEYMGYDANGYEYDYGASPDEGQIENEVAPEIPLVKADEDLKLIVGDDSPTLKPSAREFAPSQAVIAAASVPAAKNTGTDAEDEEDEDDEDMDGVAAGFGINGIIDDDDGHDEDDDELHAVGLGFDPTLNMDSVMMSPTGSPKKRSVEAEPFELALGQMTVVDTEDDVEGSPRMPFSSRIGGKKSDGGSRLLGNVSAAWSLSGAAKESEGGNAFAASTFGNWGLLGNTAGGDGSDKKPANGEAGTNEQTAASFLSLSSKLGSSDDKSPWGAGFGGLGGLGAKKADG